MSSAVKRIDGQKSQNNMMFSTPCVFGILYLKYVLGHTKSLPGTLNSLVVLAMESGVGFPPSNILSGLHANSLQVWYCGSPCLEYKYVLLFLLLQIT